MTLVVGTRNSIIEQVAQLSQTDLAAGWVSFGQMWKTMSIFNHHDVIGLQSYQIR